MNYFIIGLIIGILSTLILIFEGFITMHIIEKKLDKELELINKEKK